MKKTHLPDLPDTGRKYVEHTVRARLASPGIERYSRPRGPGRSIAIAIAFVLALLGAMLWLS